MTVERICQRDVDTATADESVFQAAERMHQRTVGALVVIDDDRVPIGIVTDRDLVVRAIAGGREAYTTAVRDVMTAWPKTIAPETPIAAALSLMREGTFRRLPVVNAQRRLVGIVALDDILMELSEQLTEVGSIVQRETPQAAATAGRSAR